jgi:molybdopterin synthase catalytic subunit
MSFLTRAPIQLDGLIAEVAGPDRGGVASFLGTVRDHHEGRPVRGLEYTAYDQMAEEVCREILLEAAARWPVRVTLRHRLGRLAIGEVAVAVVAAGGHRDEAFTACRYVIEELKRRVPIWKRETFVDGTSDWVNASEQAIGSGQSAMEETGE